MIKITLENQTYKEESMIPIAYLVQEGLCGFLSTYMQQIFVNVQCQSETTKYSIRSLKISLKSNQLTFPLLEHQMELLSLFPWHTWLWNWVSLTSWMFWLILSKRAKAPLSSVVSWLALNKKSSTQVLKDWEEDTRKLSSSTTVHYGYRRRRSTRERQIH